MQKNQDIVRSAVVSKLLKDIDRNVTKSLSESPKKGMRAVVILNKDAYSFLYQELENSNNDNPIDSSAFPEYFPVMTVAGHVSVSRAQDSSPSDFFNQSIIYVEK